MPANPHDTLTKEEIVDLLGSGRFFKLTNTGDGWSLKYFDVRAETNYIADSDLYRLLQRAHERFAELDGETSDAKT